MIPTGIIKRIDDMGKVAIPKVIRDKFNIQENDPLEIYINGKGEITFKKYDQKPEEKESFLNGLASEIHKNAVAHGWWEEERELPEILMLCVSELAEALEEYRNGRKALYYANSAQNKPEGIAVEMADCIIRILDWCGKERIDIDSIIRQKMEYNKTRPYRHGGKRC